MQVVHHTTQTPVHGGDHGSEVGVLLTLQGHRAGSRCWRKRLAQFITVILEQLTIAGQHGPVHHPVPEIEKKRLALVLLHELQRGLGELIVGVGDPLGLLVAEGRIFFHTQGVLLVFGGGEVRGAVLHAAVHASGMIDKLKAVVVGTRSDMPFANMAGFVAVVFHGIGQGQVIEVEVLIEIGRQKLILGSALGNFPQVDMGEAELCRVLAGDDARTGGGAAWCG